MKINIWLLMEQMQNFDVIANISDGADQIEHFRICSSSEQACKTDTLYLCQQHDGVHLINGNDFLLFPLAKAEELANAVLSLFDRLQTWEDELRSLASQRSLQGLIDSGSAILENPLVLSDTGGNILAMSKAFLGEDINPYWTAAKDEGRIPLELLGSPMYDSDGTLRSWGDEPNYFQTPDGTSFIGTYIRIGGTRLAGMGLWEHKRKIRRGDLVLFSLLSAAVSSTLESRRSKLGTRSLPDILRDILDGKEIEKNLLSNLNISICRPWQLLLISNPFRADGIYRESLLSRMEQHNIPNICFMYDEHILALAAEKDMPTLVDTVRQELGRFYYQFVVSLPFDSIDNLPVRYHQTLYALKHCGIEPGIYKSEDFCFSYLLSRFSQINSEQGLSHPVLAALRRYDAEKNTEYYQTLFAYLIHERSILRSAEYLHIHKNSFLYRIQKIREMTGLELDDPSLRSYLILSYYMEA